jgi:hypothetical protein
MRGILSLSALAVGLAMTACAGSVTGFEDEDGVDGGQAGDLVPDGGDRADAAARLQDADDGSPSRYAFHPRETWQSPDQPVSGPSMDLLALRYITVHYNGDTRDLSADYGAVLRAMQNSWLTSRGYSLGYNSGIAPSGDEWEIRGLAFRAAANGCQDVNNPAYTIQITLPTPTSQPTDAQIEGTRQAVARVREAARAAGNTHELYLNGHNDVRPLCDGLGGTSCPGEAINELLSTGAFEP